MRRGRADAVLTDDFFDVEGFVAVRFAAVFFAACFFAGDLAATFFVDLLDADFLDRAGAIGSLHLVIRCIRCG